MTKKATSTKLKQADIDEIEQEAKKAKNQYIDNKKFLEELTTYLDKCKKAKKEGKEEPPIPNYIGECFAKIAFNLSQKHNFRDYSYVEDMRQEGLENCLTYFRNFDPSKGSNPFSYFTQIIWYAFIRRIAKEKKQSYIKYKLTEQFGIDTLLEAQEDTEEGFRSTQEPIYDNMADYIHSYEEKVEEKRKKRSKKKRLEDQRDEDLPEREED